MHSIMLKTQTRLGPLEDRFGSKQRLFQRLT